MVENQTDKSKQLYDLYTILDPRQDNSQLEKTREEIVRILEKHNANIERVAQFAKTALAYPIRKEQMAYAGSIYFWVQPEEISAIQEELKTSDADIVRSIVTKNEPKKAKESKRSTRRAAAHAEKVAAAATTTATEAKPAQEQPAESSETADVAQTPTATTNEDEVTPKKEEKSEEKEEGPKVTLDDIDKRLDEIMGEL